MAEPSAGRAARGPALPAQSGSAWSSGPAAPMFRSCQATRAVRMIHPKCTIGGSYQLHQNPAGVLGVHEVDPRAGRAASRGVVEQSQPTGPQRGAGRLDVGHRVRELLQARAAAVEELRDRRVRAGRGEQLQPRAGGVRADGEHRLAYPLLLVRLLVHAAHAERLGVEREGLVQVGHRDRRRGRCATIHRGSRGQARRPSSG